jgi:murein DD-endopeptidase MepM/ murein hydrolase activator NlpD
MAAFLRPILLCLLLAACSAELKGRAQPYDPRVPDPVAVTMPAGAHWISQQFAPVQEDVAYAHRGIDIRAKTGTPVIAAAPGRVVAAFADPMHGRQVVLDHGVDADGARVVTRYHHLSRIDVAEGQLLARGARVGLLGSSGAAAVFEHLHFELRRGESVAKARPVDPQLYWVAGPGRVTCFEPGRDWPERPVRITYPVACD